MKFDLDNKFYIAGGILIFLTLAVLGFVNVSLDSKGESKSVGTSSNTVAETKSNAKAELIKTNWNAYTDSIDTNWAIVTGVIKNTGDSDVKLDDASATLYDAQGKVVGNGTNSIYPRIIAPNEEAFVAVRIMDTVKKSEINNAKIQFSFDETKEAPKKINAINDSGKLGTYSGFEVTGELENTSSEETKDARALVLFFDKDKNLINAEIAYPTPDIIPPQGTVAFKANASHLEDMIASYQVIGFSMQWGF